MRFIPNAGDVLLKATSMWAVYGGLAVLLVDYGAKWLQSDASAGLSPGWRDGLLALCLALAPVFRIIQQRSLQPPAIAPMKNPTRPLQGDPE